MAIPFEAAPATVFKESDIAEFGLALQDRQEAREQRERERYEKTLESVSGPYWAERDTWVTQGGNKLLEMATDPAYYRAPIGSANHNKFIRAKRQYEQLLATSAANQKYFNEQLKFAQQNPDAEGMQDLNAYVGMDMQGDVEIDEAGNFVVAGQPIITSDAMSTPPSLRKRRDVYTFDKFEDRVNVGISSYENENGVTTVSPNDAEALVRIVYKTSRPQDKRDLLNIYMANNLGLTAEQVDMLDPEEIAIYEEAMLKEQTKAALLRSDTKTSRESGGGSGLFGVDNSKVTVTPLPVGELSMKIKVGEGDAAVDKTVKSDLYGFSTKPISWVGGENRDKGTSYFIDSVQFDELGNMVVSGYKLIEPIEAALLRSVTSDIEAGYDPTTVFKNYGLKTEPLTQKKLSESEASSFSSSLKDKHKALAPLKTVAQIRDWTADYVGYTPKGKEEVVEEEGESQSSGDGLNATKIKEQKQNTNQNTSNDLNASNRKGGASVQSNKQGDKEQSDVKGPEGLAISDEESQATTEDGNSIVVNNETEEQVVESPNGKLPRSVVEYNKREGLSKDDMLIDVLSDPIYILRKYPDTEYDRRKQIKSVYGEDRPIILSNKTKDKLEIALIYYDGRLSEDERKDFREGRSPIVIADTYVPSSVKLQAKEKYDKNLESYNKNGYWVNDSNQTVRTPPPKQAGEKSFHTSGNAIDLAQNEQNKNNKKLFNSLRKAGFKQHPNEWWHWSIGEFDHEELTDEQIEGRKAMDEYNSKK